MAKPEKKQKHTELINQAEFYDLVCDRLGVEPHTLRRMRKNGAVPKPSLDYSRQNRWWRRDVVEAWLEGKVS